MVGYTKSSIKDNLTDAVANIVEFLIKVYYTTNSRA